MPRGYVALVLHAHLPYVRHPEHDRFLEEDWLFEAVTETYIPLLNAFEHLVRDGVDFRLTMTLTPPLISMLQDDLLRERIDRHLGTLSELVDKELDRTRFDGHLNYLARHYRAELDHALRMWRDCDGDLIRPFAKLQDRGQLEIITSGATHGYLPLMQTQPEAVWAQIKVAVDHYGAVFGRAPRGLWLPECAYYPGVDLFVRDAGLRFFVMDAHGVLYAQPRPRYGNFAPLICERSGVAAFGRDLETSNQVWSQEQGYPGDAVYREFYRDIGYDLDFDYIGPYVQPTGARKNTGIKYHRITGKTNHKELYDPHWAREKAAQHAANFMFNRERQIEHLADTMDRAPIVVCPYDAELYGHWWYEGPWWLELVIRKSAYDQQVYQLTHLAGYLEHNDTQQIAQPAQSSWGHKGYHEFWLNDRTDWIYPHLHKAAERMIQLAQDDPAANGLRRRALNQAARELLLAQSSDWAFIMKTGTMSDYAARRTQSHLRRFMKLHDDLRRNTLDEGWLERVEWVDNIFPAIDYRTYSRRP